MIRLIENWKTTVDKNLSTAAVLRDLFKAFERILHDLLIAKFHAYGLSFDTVTFLNTYSKDRKQNVRINNIFSAFQNDIESTKSVKLLGITIDEHLRFD